MRHETNYNSINLLYNGGWELADSEGIPAFWDISGAEQESALSVYTVVPEGLKLQLSSRSAVTITQTFTAPSGPLDFLSAEDYRGMPYGYVEGPARVLSLQDNWTLAFDVNRRVGPCTVKARVSYAGTHVDLVTADGSTELTISDVQESRPHFYLTGSEAPTNLIMESLTITVTSTAPSEVTLDRIQLSLGRYGFQPYTGDPFLEIFPKDCVVMTLGDLCPAGFEELGDGDLTVPPEWGEDEPGIRARKGNYPADGTELAGAPKHGAPNDTTSVSTNVSASFESRFGRAFQEAGIGPDFLADSNNPLVDQTLEHTHEVNKASSRVLAVEYLFCKRV